MPIFFTKKSCNRGGGTTPQMPLTVKTAKYSQKVAFPSLSSLTLLRLGFFDFLRTGGGVKMTRGLKIMFEES